MTTAAQARASIEARVAANLPTNDDSNEVTVYWQNQPVTLPDTPAPFVYAEFLTDPAELASFGSGRSGNRYRNPARIDFYVFVPRDEGMTEAESIAEQLATLFRSYRDSSISCFDASVLPGGDGAALKPPGITSEVSNYFFAVTEVSLFFDIVG